MKLQGEQRVGLMDLAFILGSTIRSKYQVLKYHNRPCNKDIPTAMIDDAPLSDTPKVKYIS